MRIGHTVVVSARLHDMDLGFASSARPASLLLRAAGLAILATLAAGCFDPDHGQDLEASASEGTSTGSTGAPGSTGVGGAETSSSSSTGGVAESSTGADTGGNDELCSDYCSLIGDHCEDEFAQYGGDSLCESTCAGMPPGSPGDELGNSASCRTFHAVLAARTPETHCPHAGPAGAGTCGANCESFCTLALNLCEGDLSVYASAEECIEECEGFEPEPLYSADVPDGDTFACRVRHLTLASLQPEVHCSHLGPDSPVCFD